MIRIWIKTNTFKNFFFHSFCVKNNWFFMLHGKLQLFFKDVFWISISFLHQTLSIPISPIICAFSRKGSISFQVMVSHFHGWIPQEMAYDGCLDRNASASMHSLGVVQLMMPDKGFVSRIFFILSLKWKCASLYMIVSFQHLMNVCTQFTLCIQPFSCTIGFCNTNLFLNRSWMSI